MALTSAASTLPIHSQALVTKMPKSLKLHLLVLLMALIASPALAANWYVRPSGGTGSGSSWTAAWNGLGAIQWGSVACGDTIWVAGGSYSQSLSLTKTGCASTSRVYIRKARADAAECTGAAGWSSAYDSTVHQTRSSINVSNANYMVVSGRTSASGGANGWWIDFTGATSGTGIEWPNDATGSNNTLEYIDIQGPGNITYSSDGRGIDATPFSSASGNLFSHLKIWNWESGIYNAGINNSTFEYIDEFDIMAVNWSSFHPNGIYISGSANGVVRYSKFHKGPGGNGTGEGIFVEQSGNANGWQIYGNVFYDLTSTLKAIEITAPVSGWKIYNNTFVNITIPPGEYSANCSSSEYRNNFFYATSVGSCGTASNNVTAGGTDRFVNYGAKDFHIVSTTGSGYARNAGVNLSSLFTLDMDGDSFGSDGTWDVGAYAYGGAVGTQPNPPAGLTAVVQ
jgi:hypothetical protein